MKKVLLVSKVFPPSTAVGVYRVIKFCKFLPAHGWQPVVLTARRGRGQPGDDALLTEIDPGIAVYRARNPEPVVWWERFRARWNRPAPVAVDSAPSESARSDGRVRPVSWRQRLLNSMSIPDDDVFWTPFAIALGLQSIRREGISAILSTSPPSSTHLASVALSRMTGLPLVLDFRDLWTQNEGYHRVDRLRLARLLDRALERDALKRARAIVAATGGFVGQLAEGNPALDPVRMTAILNGLDRDDFSSVVFPTTRNEKFTLLHLGSLYGQRDPAFFFEVLDHFLAAHPEAREKITVRFIGTVASFEHLVRDRRLDDVVELVGHRPHNTVLQELWQADALLFILGFETDAANVIPAKLFEYVAAARPILGFIPHGEAEAVIRRHSSGELLTEPDLARATASLEKLYTEWLQRSGAPTSILNIPPEFDRRGQARQLADVLDAVCMASSRNREGE